MILYARWYDSPTSAVNSESSCTRAESMLSWDVSNGLARRSWAGNANAPLTIREEMQRQDGLAVTLPVRFFNLLWIEPDDGRQDSVG